MLDVNNSQSVNINAVSGTIVKNYRKSFFVRFHIKSRMSDQLFSTNPTLSRGGNRVEVLQVMLCGDGECIAEVMWSDDFENTLMG